MYKKGKVSIELPVKIKNNRVLPFMVQPLITTSFEFLVCCFKFIPGGIAVTNSGRELRRTANAGQFNAELLNRKL